MLNLSSRENLHKDSLKLYPQYFNKSPNLQILKLDTNFLDELANTCTGQNAESICFRSLKVRRRGEISKFDICSFYINTLARFNFNNWVRFIVNKCV